MKAKTGLILAIVICALLVIAGTILLLLDNVLDLFQSTRPPAVNQTTVTVYQTPAGQEAASNLTPDQTFTAEPGSDESAPADSDSPDAEVAPLSEIQVEIVSVEGSGFSRIVNGKLTNTGTVDLHNPRLKVEIYSNGKLIKNDGEEYVERSYATIPAGASLTDELAIKISLIDGLYVTQNGVTFVITFTSDELTTDYQFDYQP